MSIILTKEINTSMMYMVLRLQKEEIFPQKKLLYLIKSGQFGLFQTYLRSKSNDGGVVESNLRY